MIHHLKTRTHQILAPATPGDHLSRGVDIFLMVLIALNVLALVVESVEHLHMRAPRLLQWFETLSVGIFSVEYVLRVWSATASPRFVHPVKGRLRFMLTPLAIFDLLAILPFYLPAVGVDLRFVRAFRLFRMFRVLKLGRYSRALQQFGQVFVGKKEELVVTLSVMALLLLLASSLMYIAEHDAQPDAFSSIPMTMWWGIATLTTVGYGDVYPITPLGKLLGAVIAILGIGMFALPTGILGAGFVEAIGAGKKPPASLCPHCGKPIDIPPPSAAASAPVENRRGL